MAGFIVGDLSDFRSIQRWQNHGPGFSPCTFLTVDYRTAKLYIASSTLAAWKTPSSVNA